MLAVPTPLVSTVRTISMYVYVLSTTYNHHFLLNSVEIESGGFSCDACRYGLVLRSHSMYVCVYVYMHECMFCRIVFMYTMLLFTYMNGSSHQHACSMYACTVCMYEL